MEKNIESSWTKKISLIQKKIEKLLDHPHENDPMSAAISVQEGESFCESNSQTLISGINIGLPDDHIGRAVVTFSRLSLFFISGIFLENLDGKWQPQVYFFRGKIQNFSIPDRPRINLPQIDILQVLKTPSRILYKKLGLEKLVVRDDNSTLLLKMTPDFAFVLTSSFSEPWLKERTEMIQKQLLNAFAD